MEELCCTFASCKNPAKYICDCNSAQFCKIHIPEHKKLSSQPHSIEPLFYAPNPETKAIIIKEIIKAETKLNENEAKLFESLSHMISNLENLVKSVVISTELNLNKSLTTIKQAKKVSRLEKNPILNLLTHDSKEAMGNLRLILESEFELKLAQILEIAKKIEEEAEYFRPSMDIISPRKSEPSSQTKDNIYKQLISHMSAIIFTNIPNYYDEVLLKLLNDGAAFDSSLDINDYARLKANLNRLKKPEPAKGGSKKCGHQLLLCKPSCGYDHCAHCLKVIIDHAKVKNTIANCEHGQKISPWEVKGLESLLRTEQVGGDNTGIPKGEKMYPCSLAPSQMKPPQGNYSNNFSPQMNQAPPKLSAMQQKPPAYQGPSILSGPSMQPGSSMQPRPSMQSSSSMQLRSIMQPSSIMQSGQSIQPGQNMQTGQNMQRGQNMQPNSNMQPNQNIQPGPNMQPNPSMQPGPQIQYVNWNISPNYSQSGTYNPTNQSQFPTNSVPQNRNSAFFMNPPQLQLPQNQQWTPSYSVPFLTGQGYTGNPQGGVLNAPNSGIQCYQCEQIMSFDDFSIDCPSHTTCNICRVQDVTKCINCERGYSDNESELLVQFVLYFNN
ncbi:unnamed protein product [Blepharisma stoltei]|uniref:RING-type domain-containing protein n=1 Tax=Blepharisma stoltei TaxID=1481888 RepID=A0AAU9IYN8_9CILI|nr:unnamed protein product [Blepharisma stoltei]